MLVFILTEDSSSLSKAEKTSDSESKMLLLFSLMSNFTDLLLAFCTASD